MKNILKRYWVFLGFSIIEVIIVIAVLSILAVISFTGIRAFQKESALKNTTEEIVNALRVAQNKAVASEGSAKWGVYFATSTTVQEYVVFKGTSYATRDVSKDISYGVPRDVEIYEINLIASSSEIIFNRITGNTNHYGDISLRLKQDIAKTKTVIVEASGKTTSATVAMPSQTNRITDSRHVHFDYGRVIDTLNEKLVITFYDTPNIVKELALTDYMQGSQIFWEGEINVNGSIQGLKIHTHLLNDIVLDTQFCVHRERMYNDKALTIELSGDSTGSLIEYSADGITTKGSSTYVSDPIWQ